MASRFESHVDGILAALEAQEPSASWLRRIPIDLVAHEVGIRLGWRRYWHAAATTTRVRGILLDLLDRNGPAAPRPSLMT